MRQYDNQPGQSMKENGFLGEYSGYRVRTRKIKD